MPRKSTAARGSDPKTGDLRCMRLDEKYERTCDELQSLKHDKKLVDTEARVAAVEAVLDGKSRLTDACINAVFRDKRLLKEDRKRRKRTERPDDDPEALDLEMRAKRHRSYLRKLRNRGRKRLTSEELGKMRRYVDEKRRWCRSLREDRPLVEYLLDAAPIMREYERERATIREELQESQKRFREEGLRAQKALPAPDTPQLAESFQSSSERFPLVPSNSGNNKKRKRPAPTDIDSMLPPLEMYRSVRRLTVRYRRDVEGELAPGIDSDAEREAEMAATEESEGTCPECEGPRFVDAPEGCIVCRECGLASPYQAWDKQSLPFDHNIEVRKDPNQYERINHFREWLNKIECKRTEIPEHVYTEIYREARRLKLEWLDLKLTRWLLSRLKLSKYYDHWASIAHEFNGIPKPQFTRVQKDTLIRMFNEAQEPFERCPASIKHGRRNFITYSYFLYKCCEMRGWTEFLPYFKLLQGEDNLRIHDDIFEWICNNKQGEVWVFIRTI